MTHTDSPKSREPLRAPWATLSALVIVPLLIPALIVVGLQAAPLGPDRQLVISLMPSTFEAFARNCGDQSPAPHKLIASFPGGYRLAATADDSDQTRIAQDREHASIRQTLDAVQQSLASVAVLAQETRGKLGPLLVSLRQTSDAARTTLTDASATLGTARDVLDGRPRRAGDLPALLRELRQATRSVHLLADYLQRHPEALVAGKPGEPKP